MGLEAKDMNVAVVGMGYWGPNLVRVFREMGVRVFLHDHDPERLRTAVERFPDCTPKERLEEILDDPAISAVALAVPLQHHYALTALCLGAGKNVFVEKPLCATVREADAIASMMHGKVCMVGHITAFSPGIRELTRRIQSGTIGELRHVSLRRTHLGPIYRWTDVLTEVAAHDIAILLSIVGESPEQVNAWGIERLGLGQPDRAILIFTWANGLVGKAEVAWSSALRRRRILLEGREGSLVWEADAGKETLTRFAESASFDLLRNAAAQPQVAAALWSEQLTLTSAEPLREELAEFLSAIEEHRAPCVSIAFSRRVVAVLEAARTSMEGKGIPVRVAE